jgi:hypothetical protein
VGTTWSFARLAFDRTDVRVFNADLTDLDRAAGVNVESALLACGADAVGAREALLGDSGPARGRFGARFTDKDMPVPLVAYVVTRVAPVAVGFPA